MTKLQKARLKRSALTRKYLSKIQYKTGEDDSLLSAVWKPLKTTSKRGKELYSKRTFKQIKTYYQAVLQKEKVVSKKIYFVDDKGKKRMRTQYFIGNKNSVLVPYKGKTKKDIESVLKRRRHSLWLKKFGQGSIKDIAKSQNLTTRQTEAFKGLVASEGFDRKGKMSRRMGFLYKEWIEKTTGEVYSSEKHTYGSEKLIQFEEEFKNNTFFEHVIDFIKETNE